MNEVKKCPSCGNWVIPGEITCPSCSRPAWEAAEETDGFLAIEKEREAELERLRKEMEGVPAAGQSAFVLPSMERRYRQDSLSRARRNVLIKRAAVAVAIALGAVLGNLSLGLFQGHALGVILEQAGCILLYGLGVGPLLLLIARWVVLARMARRESSQTDPDDPTIQFLVSPWRYARFLVWASPAVSAGWNVAAGSWSWLRFGFAAAGSLGVAVVALRAWPEEGANARVSKRARRHTPDTPPPPGQNWQDWGGGLLIVAALAGLLSLVGCYVEIQFALHGQRAQGTVRDVWEITRKSRRTGISTSYTINYDFIDAGGTKRSGSDFGEAGALPDAGDPIEIIYIAGNPSDSRISRGVRWDMVGILAGSIALAGIGWCLRLYGKSIANSHMEVEVDEHVEG